MPDSIKMLRLSEEEKRRQEQEQKRATPLTVTPNGTPAPNTTTSPVVKPRSQMTTPTVIVTPPKMKSFDISKPVPPKTPSFNTSAKLIMPKTTTSKLMQDLSGIVMISQYDQEYGNQLYQALLTSSRHPDSPYYMPYSKPTNSIAINALQQLGVDTTIINTDWFEKNAWAKPYYRISTDGTPLAPTKKSSREEQIAYYYYKLYQDEERTTKVETEINNLRNKINYMVFRADKNYSDEDILSRINWADYPALTALREEKAKGKPMPLNRAVDFNDDTVYGMIWAARNGETTGNSLTDALQYTLGTGKQYKADAKIQGVLDPTSESYNPYAAGSTLDDEAEYFGVSMFPENWADEHRDILASGDPAAVKMYQNVVAAEQLTQKAFKEQDDLNQQIGKRFLWNQDSDTTFPQTILNGLLDNYPTLKKMDESRRTGKLLGLTRPMGFSWEDIVSRVNMQAYTVNMRKDSTKYPNALNAAMQIEKSTVIDEQGTALQDELAPESQTGIETIWDTGFPGPDMGGHVSPQNQPGSMTILDFMQYGSNSMITSGPGMGFGYTVTDPDIIVGAGVYYDSNQNRFTNIDDTGDRKQDDSAFPMTREEKKFGMRYEDAQKELDTLNTIIAAMQERNQMPPAKTMERWQALTDFTATKRETYISAAPTKEVEKPKYKTVAEHEAGMTFDEARNKLAYACSVLIDMGYMDEESLELNLNAPVQGASNPALQITLDIFWKSVNLLAEENRKYSIMAGSAPPEKKTTLVEKLLGDYISFSKEVYSYLPDWFKPEKNEKFKEIKTLKLEEEKQKEVDKQLKLNDYYSIAVPKGYVTQDQGVLGWFQRNESWWGEEKYRYNYTEPGMELVKPARNAWIRFSDKSSAWGKEWLGGWPEGYLTPLQARAISNRDLSLWFWLWDHQDEYGKGAAKEFLELIKDDINKKVTENETYRVRGSAQVYPISAAFGSIADTAFSGVQGFQDIYRTIVGAELKQYDPSYLNARASDTARGEIAKSLSPAEAWWFNLGMGIMDTAASRLIYGGGTVFVQMGQTLNQLQYQMLDNGFSQDQVAAMSLVSSAISGGIEALDFARFMKMLDGKNLGKGMGAFIKGSMLQIAKSGLAEGMENVAEYMGNLAAEYFILGNENKFTLMYHANLEKFNGDENKAWSKTANDIGAQIMDQFAQGVIAGDVFSASAVVGHGVSSIGSVRHSYSMSDRTFNEVQALLTSSKLPEAAESFYKGLTEMAGEENPNTSQGLNMDQEQNANYIPKLTLTAKEPYTTPRTIEHWILKEEQTQSKLPDLGGLAANPNAVKLASAMIISAAKSETISNDRLTQYAKAGEEILGINQDAINKVNSYFQHSLNVTTTDQGIVGLLKTLSDTDENNLSQLLTDYLAQPGIGINDVRSLTVALMLNESLTGTPNAAKEMVTDAYEKIVSEALKSADLNTGNFVLDDAVSALMTTTHNTDYIMKRWGVAGLNYIANLIQNGNVEEAALLAAMPTYAHSVIVAEKNMDSFKVTPQAFQAQMEAFHADLNSTFITKNASKRAGKQAVDARVAELTDNGALGDFTELINAVSASQSVLNKAKEEYKAASQNENAVVRALWAAHVPFSQNPADSTACDALIAVLDRIPYARSATAKAKANLNNAQKAFDLANRNLGIAQQQAKAKVNAQALADIAKNQQTRADARAALAGQNVGQATEQAAANPDQPSLENVSNEGDHLEQSDGNKSIETSKASYLSFLSEKLNLSPSELLSRMITTAQAEAKPDAKAETEPETANRQMEDDAESTSQETEETVQPNQPNLDNVSNEEDLLAQGDESGIMGEGEPDYESGAENSREEEANENTEKYIKPKLIPPTKEIKEKYDSEGLSQDSIDKIVSLPKSQKPKPETYLSSKYIEEHKQSFIDFGVVKIMPTEPTGTIGGKGGTFVMSGDQLDNIITSCNGDISKIEEALGFDKGYLGKNPVIVEIHDVSCLRLPQGNELGALPNYWLPGGYTIGGIKEAVIDPAPVGTYTFRHLF